MTWYELDSSPNIIDPPTFDPKHNIKVAVVSFLRASIIRGDIKAGAVLHESDLQTKFGISRPPIREALVQLEQEGLIKTFPKKGSVVTEVDIEQIKQSLFVRSNLEASNIELLMQNIDIDGLEQLDASNNEQIRLLQSENFHGLYDSMDKFHHILFKLNGLPAVWELIRREKISLDRIHALNVASNSLTSPKIGHFERMNLMYTQHVDLVDSLRNKDLIKGALIIKSHANIDFNSASNHLNMEPRTTLNNSKNKAI
jgi:DNA-binding GntR family transcriptional regulator